MTPPRLPSPLRPLAWNGTSWVPPADAGTMPVDEIAEQWLAWARKQHFEPYHTIAANAALDLLRHGATTAAAMGAARIAARRAGPGDLAQLRAEQAWIESVIDDLKRIKAPPDVIELYSARQRAVAASISAYYNPPAAAGDPYAESNMRFGEALRVQARPEAGVGDDKPKEPPRPFSLRDMFAEHSVLILAGLGAFLLVVATVLFELYGTGGLGGSVRLAAVVALTLVFAVAGYLARRRSGLEAVGHIYIALAAVLLPLVGVAAWTFLDLGTRGVTVYQAVAITAAACAAVYGTLAARLDFRAYGEMTGIALLLAIVSVSRWVGGDYWLAAGVAAGPLVYAVWERALRARVFTHFQWFGHASALVALGAAVRYQPDGWLWTATFAVLAVSYLGWQWLAAQPARAWIGEAAAIFAAAVACVPLGVGSGHFVLPMLVAMPLIALSRQPELFGRVGALYRPHVGHVHLAVICGLALAAWAFSLGEGRSLAAGLWIAFALYAADYYAGASELTGYTLRAALVLALVATGRALELGPWTASLTALALIAYVAPFTRDSLAPLRRFASPFFYAALVVVLSALVDARIGPGHWEIVATLVISALAFGAAAEFGAVRFSPITARALFALGWFVGVDALDAAGWRGPFDALLALLYVAAGQARTLARHTIATAGRRWFVHAAAAAALLLCFTGPSDEIWWRLGLASGTLAVGYWWLALTRVELELPWLASSALAGAGASFAIATVGQAWQGTILAAEAVVLTAIWFALRRWLSRTRMPTSAFVVLAVLAATGGSMTLRQVPPTWPQCTASLLIATFLFAWSMIRTEHPLPAWRPYQRSGAAYFASMGVLIACAVPELALGVVGLVAIAIAAAHSEWSVRAKNDVERWYALAAMLATAPVIYLWPYAHDPAAVVAVEFIALAALVAVTAIRTRRWYFAYPAVLLLAPALRFGFIAVGVQDDVVNEIGFAILAWLVGFAGVTIRTRFSARWAWTVEIAGATIAFVTLLAMAINNDPDPAGIAILAYAPLIYTSAMQDRMRWMIPVAPAAAFGGATILLASRNADTILYAAALGVVGVLMWGLGRVAFMRLGAHPVVDMHRYLGGGTLVTSAAAGFFFPERTGTLSLGAGLAAFALAVTGAVLWLDSVTYDFRANRYSAIVASFTAGFFVARFVNLQSWELLGPGVGLVATGIALRQDTRLRVNLWLRRLLVATGMALAMAWAATLTVEGDVWWLVVLLIEGAVTVAAGVALRSQTLLAGGGVALALASLRAMLLIAMAGYLFVAFAAVALVLLAVATALALGRERYLSRTNRMRERLSHWD